MQGMAGGMNKRGSWGPMSDRLARTATPSASAAEPTIKPCWVDGADGLVPALLLEWRQDVGGWMGRVVRPVREDGAWVVVEEWLPGELLRPGG